MAVASEEAPEAEVQIEAEASEDDAQATAQAVAANPAGLEQIASIAEAAATAILNSQLHAQSRRELRRRDALRRVVASISSELDLDSLFDRVIGSAVELLDADSTSRIIFRLKPEAET